MVAVGGGRSEGRSGGDVGNLSACQLCRSRLIERNCDSIGMSPQCARVIYDQRNVPTCSLQETKIDALHQDMKQIKDTADARCGVCSAGLVFVEWRWRKLEAWKLGSCDAVRYEKLPVLACKLHTSNYNPTTIRHLLQKHRSTVSTTIIQPKPGQQHIIAHITARDHRVETTEHVRRQPIQSRMWRRQLGAGHATAARTPRDESSLFSRPTISNTCPAC